MLLYHDYQYHVNIPSPLSQVPISYLPPLNSLLTAPVLPFLTLGHYFLVCLFLNLVDLSNGDSFQIYTWVAIGTYFDVPSPGAYVN